MTDQARTFARHLVDDGVVPRGSEADAAHIAAATMNGMRFLVTWNCKPIANAFTIARLTALCKAEGLALPTICTPDQFSEAEPDVESETQADADA